MYFEDISMFKLMETVLVFKVGGSMPDLQICQTFSFEYVLTVTVSQHV
jgi:hypothetical protein